MHRPASCGPCLLPGVCPLTQPVTWVLDLWSPLIRLGGDPGLEKTMQPQYFSAASFIV